MKTIGLYIVAGASGTRADAESQTQTPIPGCVGEWGAAAGRGDEQAAIDPENGDRQSERKFKKKGEITGDVIFLNKPNENISRPLKVEPIALLW